MATMHMLRRVAGASLLALAAGLAAPALSGPAAAGVVQARTCSQAVGPFQTQYQAQRALREAVARGYGTGPIYGQGGLYSDYSNRRWFFTVYYAC